MRTIPRNLTHMLALAGVTLGLSWQTTQAADYEAIQPPPEFTWTGFYAGAAGGWTLDGDADYRIPSAKDLHLDHDLSGPVLGGQVGYNAQVMNWLLLGAEVQGLWSGIDGDKSLYNGALDTHSDIGWLALGKLRAGAAFDRFAVYGTGGYAGADVGASAELRYCSQQGNCSTRWSDTTWANGYFYGLGAAYSVNDHFSIGLEWNHIVLNDADFSSKTEHGRYGGLPLEAYSDIDLDLLLATANFRF